MFSYAKKHFEVRGVGTTLVLAYLNRDDMHIAWAGDSRLYRLREGDLELVSHDHSLVQQMIDDGDISFVESLVHPDQNLVTKCLGGKSEVLVEPEFRSGKIQPGDRILLCSDGLNSMLADQQIADIMSAQQSLSDCTKALIDQANEFDGNDNITVLLIEIN